jgi:hypothetical protein
LANNPSADIGADGCSNLKCCSHGLCCVFHRS